MLFFPGEQSANSAADHGAATEWIFLGEIDSGFLDGFGGGRERELRVSIEMLRELRRLIEAAAEFASGKQRDRDHAVGVLEGAAVALAKQRSERPRQRPPPFVLERVNDLAQRAVIAPVGQTGIDEAAPAHGTVQRRLEGHAAACAQRVQQRGEQRVRRTPDRTSHACAGARQRSPKRFRFSHNAFRLMPRIAAARV